MRSERMTFIYGGSEYPIMCYSDSNWGNGRWGLRVTEDSCEVEVGLVISAVRAASGRDPVKIVNEYVQAKHGTLLPWRQWDIGKQTQLITEAMEALKAQDSTAEEATAKTQDKVIEVDELEDNLANGWMFVSNVGDERCVVRKVWN